MITVLGEKMPNKPSNIKKWNPIPSIRLEMQPIRFPPQVGWQVFNNSPYQLNIKFEIHPILGEIDLHPLLDDDINGKNPFVAQANDWVFGGGCFTLPTQCWESDKELILEIRFRVTDYDDSKKPEIELVPSRWKLVRGPNIWSYYPQIPKIASGKYYNCFISYGQPDQKFAERVKKDLEQLGVVCWFYPHDYTPGEKVWNEIKEKMRQAEKVLVICSAKSLIREGFLKEIEEQYDMGADKIIPISLDNLWKEKGFQVKRGNIDLKQSLLERNYAEFSYRPGPKYSEALKMLLSALRKPKEQ